MDVSIYVLLIILSYLVSTMFTMIKKAFKYQNKTRLKIIMHKETKKVDLDTVYQNRSFAYTISIVRYISEISAITMVAILAYRYQILEYYWILLTILAATIFVLNSIFVDFIVKRYAEKIALKSIKIVYVFMVVFYPLTIILISWYLLWQKIFKDKSDDTVTEDELLEVVEEAMEDGSIDENESDLIKSVLDFGDLQVVDIFTPRVHMVSVALTASNDKVVLAFRKSGFSRLPIYEKNLDNIVGILNHKDFYNRVLLEKESIADVMKAPVNVTEYMSVSDLLALLQSTKSHMAIVKDEFGGTLGLVTMEDILEELVGDIWDEHDEIVERISQVSQFEWNIKGPAELDDVFDALNLELDEEEFEHNTVSGWVVEQLGRIAEVGDSFTYKDYLITVNEADDKKVLEVNIKRVIDNLEQIYTDNK